MGKRESWRVTNNTSNMISIGDLPKVPTFDPGETHDLLNFQSRDKIAQSSDLESLLNTGWFTLHKRKDNSSKYLNRTIAKNAVSPAEEDELLPYALSADVYSRSLLYTKSVLYTTDETYTKTEVDALVAGGIPIPTVVTVALAGGDNTSIEDAITTINGYGDASASKPYEIRVTPGSYTENPVTVPSYTFVVGDLDKCALVTAADNNSPLFTMSDESGVYRLTITGPTNNDAIYATGGIEAKTKICIFKSSKYCVHSDGVGTIITAENCNFESTSTNGLYTTNTGVIQSNAIFSEATTNSFFANGGTILIHNSFSDGSTNGLHADNGGTIDAHLININNPTNGIRTGATGTNTINGAGIESQGTSTWDILQDNAASTIDLNSSSLLVTKLSITDWSNIFLSFDSKLEGDEGHVFVEELQVGQPESGRETVLGEGDSYTRGMMVYTETDGNVFVDVSTAAASSSGSTFTFTGVAADNSIYVSSDLQNTDYLLFQGIKMATTTAAVIGAGEIVAEYWNGAWTEFNQMSALSGSPYTQYGNDIFTRASSSEQIRFDNSIEDDWVKNDPPTTGTSRYWMRFRIKTGITTAPIFEQFKVHSSRTEINADGFLEHMGNARHTQNIAGVNINNTVPVAGKSPGNESIVYGATITLNSVNNAFLNNASDGFGQIIAVPSGLDTSMPLTYTVRWSPTTDVASGDVVLDLTYGIIAVGTVLDGTNTETTISELITTTINTAEQVYETIFTFSVPTALIEDDIILMLQRQATGATGPTGDTYAGTIYIVSIDMNGNFWH